MIKRLLILAVFLPLLIAAKPTPATCSVTPNPTAIQHDPNTSAYAYFTVNATGPQVYSIYVQEPSPGPLSTWGPYSGSGSLDWLTAYAGQGEARVMDVSRGKAKVLASCPFTVLP